MEITRVYMFGFKKHKGMTDYDIGYRTRISGENRLGKTSIGEAITWCLLGTNLVGNERATNKLLNKNSKRMQVEIDFKVNNKKHNLIRRKTGSKTDLYLDGNEVKDSDLIKFYRDKDTFLSVFNPYYYPSLAPKQAKALLNSILKKVENEEVFDKISDFEKDLLIQNNFNNPNLFLEKKREELKEIEDDIVFCEGFIAAKNEDVEIPEYFEFDETEIELFNNKKIELEEKLKELNQDEKPPLIEVDSIKREIEFISSNHMNLQKKLRNLNNKIECPNCKFEIDLDLDRKNELINELDNLENESKKLTATIAQYEDENKRIMRIFKKTLNEKELQLKDILEEYKTVSGIIQNLEKEKQKVESNNSTRERLLKFKEENVAKINKAKEDIENGDRRKKEIKIQMDAAKNFNSTKLKIQTENIKQYLDKVEIQLERMTKDGEIVDDYKILYDGNEFSLLSNSEKIRSGLEIANLIMNSTGMKFPIFLDNVESITSYKAPDTQIIETKVVEGQQEIKVEVL